MDDNDNVPQRAPHPVGEHPLDLNQPVLPSELTDFSQEEITASFNPSLPFDTGRIGVTPPRYSDIQSEESYEQYLTDESHDPRLFDQEYFPEVDDYHYYPGAASSYSHSPGQSNLRPLSLFLTSPARGEKFSELPLYISQRKRGPGRPRKDGQSPVPRKTGIRPRGSGRRGRPASYQSLTFRQAFTAPAMSTSSFQPDMMDISSNMGSSSSQSSFPGEISGFDLPPVLSESGGLMESEEEGPVHICAFCGCGERSLLGQGRLLQFDPSEGFDVFANILQRANQGSVEYDERGREKSHKPHLTWRRMRGPPKGCRERSRSPRQSSVGPEDDPISCHVIDELSLVGFTEDVELGHVYEPSGHVWAHQVCALWSVSLGVKRNEDGTTLLFVDKAVFHGLTHKCNYCTRYGASLPCCDSECSLFYHYPCAAAGGSYQDLNSLSLWCPQHLRRAEAIPSAVCVLCSSVSNVAEQLFCTSCGMHYHGTCLCPAVEVKAIVRAGWQCPNCKICQTCRHPGDDSKMLVCDTCDKGYHTFCLKPAMTTIPKNGWKCKNCRVCSDCGARTPGNGPSSRWHLNYSVCDSCYQQRNKGLCCPLCGKAYRHFHNKTMVACNKCKKFVHSECDPSIDATTLQKLKDGRPTDYVCSVCIEQEQEQQLELGPFPLQLPEDESLETFPPLKDPDDSFLSEGLLTASSQESLYDEDSSMDFDFSLIDQGLSPAHDTHTTPRYGGKGHGGKGHGGKGKLIDRGKLSAAGKKKFSSRQKGRPFSEKRRNREPIQYGDKRRGPKVKIKLGGGTPTSQIISSGSFKDDKSEDSGDDHPTTITLCNSKDMFSLDQDVCKSCGSFGLEDDKKLISCTQCGQCYHPYCASVKVTKVILMKGWRCLDCTVCEGCGKPDDEGRLLLCDDCDISYHTYCLKPPLEHVPKGNWKCKWCVSCLNCGSTTPGFGCHWKNNYTQCGPCASKVICPACRRSYQQEEIIIQCVQCDRWLHAGCDGLKNEDEAEIAADYGYHCLFCRPKTGQPGPLPPPPPPPPPEPKEVRLPSPPPITREPEPPKQYLVDGVYLFSSGMQQLEHLALQMPSKPIQRRRMRRPEPETHLRHPNVARLLSMSSQEGDDLFDKETDSLMDGNDQGGILSPPILAAGQAPSLLIPQQEPPVEYNEDGTIKKVRKKRQVRRQIGVGGFIVRQRSRMTNYKRQLSASMDPGGDQTPSLHGDDGPPELGQTEGVLKRQRKQRKSKKSKLEESFPPYLQEAFFGREVLDGAKDNKETLIDNTELEHEKFRVMSPYPLMLDGPSISLPTSLGVRPQQETPSLASTEHSDDIQNLDEGDLKDILPDGDLLGILDEGQDLDMTDTVNTDNNKRQTNDNLDNLLDEKNMDVDQILSEGLMQIDSKAVETIFGETLHPTSGPGQLGLPGHPHLPRPGHAGPSGFAEMSKSLCEAGSLPELHPSVIPGAMINKLTGMGQSLSNVGPRLPGMGVHSPLHSPNQMMGSDPLGACQLSGPSLTGLMPDGGHGFTPAGITPPVYGPHGFPANFSQQQMASPYGNDPSAWGLDDGDGSGLGSSRRNILKWEADEKLGESATISSILYVNTNFPSLIQEYPEWPERAKQIAKLWRKLSHDEKAPYLAQARKNRTSSRVQKAQRQVTQELKRRQEAQMRHDSEVMPPPPAPPPLHSPGQTTGLEHLLPGLPTQGMSPRSDLSSPLSPNRQLIPGPSSVDGQSPLHSPLHSPGTMNLPPVWTEEGNTGQPGNTDTQQPPAGLQRQLSVPDPYAFPPPSPRLDGMGATRPLSHPPRLPPPGYPQGGLQHQSSTESDPFTRPPMMVTHDGPGGPRMPDPYAFLPTTRSASSEDPFTLSTRPNDAARRSLPPDLAGVQASLSEALRTTVDVQSSDPFGQVTTPRPPTESAADPFSQSVPTSSPTSDPFSQSPMTPRPIPDPYSHPPGTPRSTTGELFNQSGAGPEGFMHSQLSPCSDPYSKPPMTPRSAASIGSPMHSPTPRTPGPLRHPDPSQGPPFRHTQLVRSQSLPDPYSSQPGTPHPMMGPSMPRTMSVSNVEGGVPQYRPVGRPGGPFPDSAVGPEGVDLERGMPGGVSPQHLQLRERLALQTKQRQMRKQIEDREKMMQLAPPAGGWPQHDGSSPRHPGMARMPVFSAERGPRPQFADPSTAQPLSHETWPGPRMVRPPHPGQFSPESENFHPRMPGQFIDNMRPGFPHTMRMGRPPGPGPGGMPRAFPSPDGSQPISQEMLAERRAHYLLLRQKGQQAAAQGQISGPLGVGQITPPCPGQVPHGPLVPQTPTSSGEPFPEAFSPTETQHSTDTQHPTDIAFHQTEVAATADDEVFRSASNLKAAIPETSSVPVEGEIHLPDIEPKEPKPSQSSEDDKHELMDDDLLNDDGTFDILRFTDPELDKILGEEENNLLDDFMDEQKPQAKEDETKAGDLAKPEVKEEVDPKPKTEENTENKSEEAKADESKDFQSKFLEFSQKRQDESEEDLKPGVEKPGEKTKGPVGVSHIAALLQGTKPLESRIDKAEAEKQEILKLAGTVEALREDMEARRQEASKQDMMGALPGPLGQRPHFGPGMASPLHHVASPHNSPNIGIHSHSPDVGGMHSPKILPSPRSGQPSPRTPGIQSPFGPMLGGPVLSPMSQQINPDQQLSPFSHPSAQSPFSPPVSSNPLSPFPSSTSGPHSPFPSQLGPIVSQPQFVLPGQVPFGSPQSVSQPSTMGPTFPMQHSSRATITPTNQYTQGTYSQPFMPPRGGTLTPSPNSILYGQSAAAQHAMRVPGPNIRSPFPGMDPSQDPRIAFSQPPGSVSQTQQQMISPTMDTRPQHMIQKIQQGLMEMGKGPTPPGGMLPSSQPQQFYRPERPLMGPQMGPQMGPNVPQALQQQLVSQGLRPMMQMRPGSPRFNAGSQRLPPPGMRMPRQQTPGSPSYQAPPPGIGPRPRSSPPGFSGVLRPGIFPPGATPPQTLLDELVEEEKKEQKRQAEQQAIARREIPNSESMMGMGPRPILGPGMPGLNVVGPRMEQRMPVLPDPVNPQQMDMMAPQFQQFPVRPSSSQLSPRTPSPFGGQSPGVQHSPINTLAMLTPQPPVTPPSDMSLENDQQRIPYEDWLMKQSQFLEMQVKVFEQSTQKQKRAKRSIQARQRQARKVGNELNASDVAELERITTEQAGLQKQLDHFRKQFRNHQSLVQDYRDKQKEQFGRNWQPILPPGPTTQMVPTPQGQMSPGGRIAVTPRMPTPSRFQGPRPNQSARGQRGPSINSVRMSPSARQEYETYMQSRLRMANPALGNPSIPAIPKPPSSMTVVGDNNPFSEDFQHREHLEKLQINIGDVSTVVPVPDMIRPFEPSPHAAPPPPPYPESSPMFPRIPGGQMGDPRFSGFNPMHPGFGIPPATLPPEMGKDNKPKKRRKTKKKSDEMDNAQSQPLPPSLPNQAALLGQMSSQSGHTPPVNKPEFPVKPHSETERRILEILSNTAALSQQKSTSSSQECPPTPAITTTAQTSSSTTLSVASSCPDPTVDKLPQPSLPSQPSPQPPGVEAQNRQSPFGPKTTSQLRHSFPQQVTRPSFSGTQQPVRQMVPYSQSLTPPVASGIQSHTGHGYSMFASPGTPRLPPPGMPGIQFAHLPNQSTQMSQDSTEQKPIVGLGTSPSVPETSSKSMESTQAATDTDAKKELLVEAVAKEQAMDKPSETSESSTDTKDPRVEDAGSVEPEQQLDPPAKQVCTDGIHCGTDDEEDEEPISEPANALQSQTPALTTGLATNAVESELTESQDKEMEIETDVKEDGQAEISVSATKHESQANEPSHGDHGKTDITEESIELDESQATVVTGTLQNVTLSASEELPLPQPCIISTSSSTISSDEILSVTTSTNQITVQTVIETSSTPETASVSSDHFPQTDLIAESIKPNIFETTEPSGQMINLPLETSVVIKTEPDTELKTHETLKTESKLAEESSAAIFGPETIKFSSEPEIIIKEEISSQVNNLSTAEEKALNLENIKSEVETKENATEPDTPFTSESSFTIGTSRTICEQPASVSSSSISTLASISTTGMPVSSSSMQRDPNIPNRESPKLASTSVIVSQSSPTVTSSPSPSVQTTSPAAGLPPGPPPPYPHSTGYPGGSMHLPPGSVSNPMMMIARPGVPTTASPVNPSGHIRQTMPAGMRHGMDPALGPRINPRMFPGGGDPRMMKMRLDPRMFRPQDPSTLRHRFDPRFMRPGMVPPGMDPRQFRPGMAHSVFDPSMMRPGMEQRMMMRPMHSQDSDQGNIRQDRYQLRNPMEPQQMQFRHPGMDPNMIRQMLHSQSTGQQIPMNMAQRPMMNPAMSPEIPASVAQSLPGQLRPPFPSPRQSGPHSMPHSTLPSNMSDLHRQMLAQQDAGSQKHTMSTGHHFNPAHQGISARPPISHAGMPLPHTSIPGTISGPNTTMDYHLTPSASGQIARSSQSSPSFPHEQHPPTLSHQMASSFATLHQTSQAVSNLEHFVSSANMPSAITNQTSSSCASTPSPHLTSPASSTSPCVMNIKQEPGEEIKMCEFGGDEGDGEQRPSQNVLLKQLLATSSARNLSMMARSETPNSQGMDETLPELTPEQQRQLEMIEEMPLCKEAEVSQEEWEKKTPEEQEAIMESRKQEYEEKRRKYEELRKAKRKIGQTNEPKQKRRRKIEGGSTMEQQPCAGVIKKRRKSKLVKDKQPGPEAEMEALIDTFMMQLRSMQGVPLQEPMIEVNHNIIPIKGAALDKEPRLSGIYGRALIDTEADFYGHFILSQMSPRSLKTLPALEKASRRRFLGVLETNMPFDMSDQQRYQLMPDKEMHAGLLVAGLHKELQLPPHPRIDSRLGLLKSDSPDTVISSSSPEFGFGEQDADFPALRPIDPAKSSCDGKISPFVQLIHPIPIKSEQGVKLEEKVDIKMEIDGLTDLQTEKQVSPKGDEMITTKLPITSSLVSPFTDPNSDQQVSVTLTLSASAAEDIGGVIAGIADLLQIAIPPTYEVRRTPSPESYKLQMTHKEQALSIHSLVKAKPKFCRHCDVVVISSGIIKKKVDLPVLTREEQESEGDEVTFCSMNCYMQFSITHQSSNNMETKESGNIVEHKSVDSTPTTSPRNVLTALSITTTPPSGTQSAGHTQPSTPTTPLSGPIVTTPKESPSPNTLSPQIKFKHEDKIGRRLKRMNSMSSETPKMIIKKWKDIRWKYWDIEISETLIKVKKHSKTEINELWCKLELTYQPNPMPEDTRVCVFCVQSGDGKPDGPSRLLNLDVNKWAHLNCSLWSSEVYETLNGALMSVDIAYKRGLTVECIRCKRGGATLSCFKVRCVNSYHLPCAQDAGCMFFQDKTIICPHHLPKGPVENELTSLIVRRRVYINRDEDRQIASMIHQEEGNHILRIGSLTLHCIGQLLPHQIQTNNFNTREYIYPVGFRTSRFYWSMQTLYKRCRYTCYIQDNDGKPEFVIKTSEPGYEDVIFKHCNPKGVWMNVFDPIEKMKRKNDLVKLYPSFVTGEEMFGLTETNIVKVLESLPGTDLLKDYNFKFGRSPLIEMPLAINPTGAARTEPKLRTHFRRPHALQTSSSSRSLPSTVTGVTGDMNSPYMKQFVHSKSQQYRRLKTEWKINVYLDRSRIQGLGLFAAKDLEKHTMVIEYIGDLIRNEVANRREKTYEEQNRGIYMFRIDDDSVIDATMSGGPARYINHSCAPNCVAEVVPFEKDSKIIIITNRRLNMGEELTYDYKFDFEDDQHKIPCSCGAGCCRKWMN